MHAAWDSYLEKRSSGLSFLHNSHPSCTGLDLEEYKMLDYDIFMVHSIVTSRVLLSIFGAKLYKFQSVPRALALLPTSELTLQLVKCVC